MHCKLSALSLLLLFSLTNYAQTKSPIDSLEKVALLQKDTTLIKTYNELTWQYRNIDPTKALAYGQNAIDLSTKYKFDKGLAQAYNDMGIIFYYKQNFDSALLLYNKALEIRKRVNDISGTAKLYNKIGIVHQQAGRFDKALEVQFMALQIFEKLNDNIGISYSLNNIGVLDQNMGRYDEAIRFQEQSIAIKEKIHDRYGLAGSYVNVGNIYLLIEKYEKAEENYVKGVDISRQISDKEYLAAALNSLGSLLIKTKRYQQALTYVKESYELRQKKNDKKGIVKSLGNLGEIYIATNQLADAEDVLLEAVKVGENEASCKADMPALYKSLSELYEKTGKGDKALANYKIASNFKDSVYTESIGNKFAELQTRYQTEKKSAQIALLGKDNSIKELRIQNQNLEISQQQYALTQNELQLSEANLHLAHNELDLKSQEELILRQKLEASEKAKNIERLQKQTQIQKLEIANRQLELTRRNVFIASLTGLLILVALLGYSFYRRKQLRQEAKLQSEILKQQELATKAVLEAEETERQRIAKDLHDGVGQMMSAAKMNLSAYEYATKFVSEEEKLNFEKIIQLVDESCTEVRAVSHNMMPNALLKNSLEAAIREFISKLDNRRLAAHLYTDGLEGRLDFNTETILYRVIQECVNNVIKHSGASTVDISIIKELKEITVTVEDNGKGFDTTDGQQFNGIGLKNIRTRIDYLKGTVDFDSAPGKGTLVALHIPL